MPTKKPAKPATKPTTNAEANATALVSVWEQDPANGNHPDGGHLIQIPAPSISATSLPTKITNPTTVPPAKIYASNTLNFRYWNTAASLARGSDFWSKQLPGTSWQVGKTLPVNIDRGEDFNAYYDRVGLNFFHGTVAGRTVFSCDSPDVVCHEQGHAILDSIKPQLWDAASIEAAAFHESFGDMSAILCALQLQSVRIGVLAETGGRLYTSSLLSRLAEQLGWAIRQISSASVEADCLRNAVNSFFYKSPNTLPSSAPSSSLSSEPHSFSRVFTAAFFEGLAGMFKLIPQQVETSLLQVSKDIGKILVNGIRSASVVPTFFSQVAVNMIRYAATAFPTITYSQALKSAFVRHGIISPATSVAFSKQAMAAYDAKAVQEVQGDILPKLNLSIAEYDLGIDSIVVHAASEPKQFDVAGAALAFGSNVSPSQDDDAKAFFEELLRQGRLKVVAGSKNKKMVGIIRPNEPDTHETNTHELRLEENEYVLRRVRIACSFH